MNQDLVVAIVTALGVPGLAVYCATLFFGGAIASLSRRVFPQLQANQAYRIILLCIFCITAVIMYALYQGFQPRNSNGSNSRLSDQVVLASDANYGFRATGPHEISADFRMAYGTSDEAIRNPEFRTYVFRNVSFNLCEGGEYTASGIDDDGVRFMIQKLETTAGVTLRHVFFEREWERLRVLYIYDIMDLDCVSDIRDSNYVIVRTSYVNESSIKTVRFDMLASTASYKLDKDADGYDCVRMNRVVSSREFAFLSADKDSITDYLNARAADSRAFPSFSDSYLDTNQLLDRVQHIRKANGLGVAPRETYMAREKWSKRDISCA